MKVGRTSPAMRVVVVVAGVVALLLVAVVVVPFGAGGDDADAHRDATPGPSGAQTSTHGDRAAKHLPGRPLTGITPAHIDPKPQGFFSTTVLWPLRNSWIAASRRRFTSVDAGADGTDRTSGAFGIFRQNYLRLTQTTQVVEVPNVGPITITAAPRGADVVRTAQQHGHIKFTSASGVTGTLNLADDSVTLHP